MTVEILYTHDDRHPPQWRGRTIHPAIPQVVADGRDLEQCRRRMRDGLDAAGVRSVTIVEFQGVLLT